MPKHRQRQNRSGAKSIGIRTKHKLGGRKSGTGALTLSNIELESKLTSVRKRDRNKLRQVMANRGLIEA